MQDNDGLYLNQTWVASAEGIAATYQTNDLSKPDALETSYTNTFQLPDSMAIRGLTLNAEQLDAADGVPYQTFTAQVISAGEVTFRGFAELTTFSNGWQVTLYEQKLNLFEKLDRSIRTADLSRYDHPWTLAGINARQNADSGVCYPCIDYGLLSGGEVPVDCVFPATFAHTILTQMLHEEGFRLSGSLPDDPVYKATVLPFVDSEPTAYDEGFQTDRQARIGMNLPDQNLTDTVDRTQAFTVDDRPLEVWRQGSLRNYNTRIYSYVCDRAMRMIVETYQAFKLRVRSGTVEVILTIEKNGQEVARNYQTYETGHNLLFFIEDTVTLKKYIPCQQGDQLRIHLKINRRTLIGGYDCLLYGQPDKSWVNFAPDLKLAFGDIWPVSRNLPNITGLQLLLTMAQQRGGAYTVDALRRQIVFTSLTDVTNNRANAVDWSSKVDTGTEPTWSPKLDPYAQRNILAWKDNDAVPAGYGNGMIEINAATLPTQTTLFELPFSASPLSEQTIVGYGAPVKVTLRTVKGTGSSATISNQSATPRLVLTYPSQAVSVPTRVFDVQGTGSPAMVFLQPCWFAGRPTPVLLPTTAYSLAFDATGDSKTEETLIQRYYSGLIRTLKRPRVLTLSVVLDPVDIAGLNFDLPIRLQRVEIGSLIISDQYFYLSKLSNYQSGQVCSATLVCFD